MWNNYVISGIMKNPTCSLGWYYGERTRDAEKGWFPGNYTKEIISSHVRARNLKQRYRLLALSSNFIQTKQQQQQQVRKAPIKETVS